MGYGEDRGLIPLTCADLFHRIDDAAAKDPLVTFTVEVSFMEVRRCVLAGRRPRLTSLPSADLQ